MVTSVKVVTVGRNFKTRQTEFATILANVHLSKLSKATEIEIKQTIRELTERPGSTGNLANSFFAERITDIEYGVGNIRYLNDVAPYWRHQNYGSLAINANWRHRVPTGQFSPGDPQPTVDSFGAGRWSAGGRYSFIPNKPIPAMNYIEKSLAKILPNVDKIIKG